MEIVHKPSYEDLLSIHSEPFKVMGFLPCEKHLRAMENVPKGNVYYLDGGEGYASNGIKFILLPDLTYFPPSNGNKNSVGPEEKAFYPDILSRYRRLLSCGDQFNNGEFENSKHLLWMLCQLEFNKDQSLTKKHRWLGYIQHALISAGLTDLMTEREYTRNIFNGE